MPSDLIVVAQYAKSRRDAPSEVYNAACRLLADHASDLASSHAGEHGAEGLRELMIDAIARYWESDEAIYGGFEMKDAADAVLSVRDEELERLRAERDAANLIIEELQGLRDTLYKHLDWMRERTERAEAERDASERKCEMAERAAQRWHDDYGRMLAERDALRDFFDAMTDQRDALKAELAETRAKHHKELASLQALAARCRSADWTHSAEKVAERDEARRELAEARAAIGQACERLDWLIAMGFGARTDTLVDLRAALDTPTAEETNDG